MYTRAPSYLLDSTVSAAVLLFATDEVYDEIWLFPYALLLCTAYCDRKKQVVHQHRSSELLWCWIAFRKQKKYFIVSLISQLRDDASKIHPSSWNTSTNRCCVTNTMGLLPDTHNCGCACAGNAGNVFPVTAGKRSRHASRHVRYARVVMHAGIAN